MKDDRIHLQHILECLKAIRSYAEGGREVFINDRKTWKATIRELQELTESTQRLSAELKNRHPDVPWQEISGLRNVLVHNYLGINLDRVWSIVKNDLAPFEKQIELILQELGPIN